MCYFTMATIGVELRVHHRHDFLKKNIETELELRGLIIHPLHQTMLERTDS
jgi:hypothetical protein